LPSTNNESRKTKKRMSVVLLYGAFLEKLFPMPPVTFSRILYDLLLPQLGMLIASSVKISSEIFM
jgi:hypothetical protein